MSAGQSNGPLDCKRCGACCCNPDENRREGYPWWVQVEPRARLLRRGDPLARLIVHDPQGVPHLRLDADQRCAALDGVVGARVRCSIYEDRPRACRRVEAGSARCRQYRAERGVTGR
jgi:Fe-S-cluster containining protein